MKHSETHSRSAFTLPTGWDKPKQSKRKKPDRETLYQLYRIDRIGAKNIGLIYGVSKYLVNEWLVQENIPRFSMSTSAKFRIARTQMVVGNALPDEISDVYMTLLDSASMISLEEDGRISKIW